MDDTRAGRAEAQLRAGVYGRLSETYDAAESVPTQIGRGADHAGRRGWTVVATFKDDGYSAFKDITRDGFGELIAAIEAGQVDVVIVRDIDRLTRNLTDWNAFEKACVRHGARLSPARKPGHSCSSTTSPLPRPPWLPDPPGSTPRSSRSPPSSASSGPTSLRTPAAGAAGTGPPAPMTPWPA